MASITTRENGGRFVSFIDASGNPQTITLGKVAMRYAQSVKVKVEDLVASSIHHHAQRDETARWLARLGDRLYCKLARAGLVQDRQCVTLKGWLEQYLTERVDCLKPEISAEAEADPREASRLLRRQRGTPKHHGTAVGRVAAVPEG